MNVLSEVVEFFLDEKTYTKKERFYSFSVLNSRWSKCLPGCKVFILLYMT